MKKVLLLPLLFVSLLVFSGCADDNPTSNELSDAYGTWEYEISYDNTLHGTITFAKSHPGTIRGQVVLDEFPNSIIPIYGFYVEPTIKFHYYITDKIDGEYIEFSLEHVGEYSNNNFTGTCTVEYAETREVVAAELTWSANKL